MNVLLTGGAGYLGSAAVVALHEAGHTVRVYDSLLYHDLYSEPVDFVRGDVRNEDALLPNLKWADAVVWLAAVVGDVACERDKEAAKNVNHKAVAWLRSRFDGRIVFPSTCSVYGHSDDVATEVHPQEPLSVYAQTKAAAETALNGDAVIFRLGTLFGLGGQHGRFRMDLVVNTMTVRACTEGMVAVKGGGQWRPLLHVQDAAKAMVVGLCGPVGTYNLVGQNMTIADLASLVVAEVPGAQIEHIEGAEGVEDPRNYRVNGDKAANVLGFLPSRPVVMGIREIKSLVRSGRLSNPSSARFTN